METCANYVDYFSSKSFNDIEPLSINLKTTVSLSSTIKSKLIISKEFEQVNTFLLSKALALFEVTMPDDLTDYPALSPPQSDECPHSPLLKYKAHHFEGSSLSLE